MDKRDVLKYLYAKKQQKMRYIINFVSTIILILYILLRFSSMELPFMDTVAAGVFLGRSTW